jgi:hypothetical protein
VDTCSRSDKEATTPKRRPLRTPKFRRWIGALVRSGRTPESLAREFEPSAVSIRKWVPQFDVDDAQTAYSGVTWAGIPEGSGR